jgi:hypothetical protein
MHYGLDLSESDVHALFMEVDATAMTSSVLALLLLDALFRALNCAVKTDD